MRASSESSAASRRSPTLRAEWEDPVLVTELRVLDDPTLDHERRQRVVREIAEAGQVDEDTVLQWVQAHRPGNLI